MSTGAPDGDAAEAEVAGDPNAAGGDATECMACHGTGTVSSGLGGTPHPVRCPWCRGTGHRIPGIDAQEQPSETAAG